MPALLRVRVLTAEERTKIEQLAHARKEAARLVQRARIIWLSHQGYRVPEIADEVDLSEYSARLWIKRFNDRGLPGLDDEPRSGRPATYSSEQASLVIETALTKPDTLGLPFACWTLDRLEAYLNEEKGVDMKRSRIDELLIREGLRWRMQETWFSERVDPDFAQKRGPSSRSTPSRRRGVS
jgi:transposase